jgi:hypothetical protein
MGVYKGKYTPHRGLRSNFSLLSDPHQAFTFPDRHPAITRLAKLMLPEVVDILDRRKIKDV